MIDAVLSMLRTMGEGIVAQLPSFLAVAALFTAIGFFARSKHSGGPWWKRPDILTDLAYAFLLPSLYAYMRVIFLAVGAGLIVGSFAEPAVAAYLGRGHGVFGGLSFWTQAALYLTLSDLMLYWTHRIFHGHALWSYHAVHHSSPHIDWMSAFRFHPINIVCHSVLVDSVLLLAGIAPEVLVFLVPFQVFMSALVHADLDWDFGPFKYVLASPMFHRWHHTLPDRGGDMNFAPTFPVFDLIFGTFYMPEGEIPDHFGIEDRSFPEGFLRQMLYPFRRGPKPAETQPAE